MGRAASKFGPNTETGAGVYRLGDDKSTTEAAATTRRRPAAAPKAARNSLSSYEDSTSYSTSDCNQVPSYAEARRGVRKSSDGSTSQTESKSCGHQVAQSQAQQTPIARSQTSPTLPETHLNLYSEFRSSKSQTDSRSIPPVVGKIHSQAKLVYETIGDGLTGDGLTGDTCGAHGSHCVGAAAANSSSSINKHLMGNPATSGGDSSVAQSFGQTLGALAPIGSHVNPVPYLCPASSCLHCCGGDEWLCSQPQVAHDSRFTVNCCESLTCAAEDVAANFATRVVDWRQHPHPHPHHIRSARPRARCADLASADRLHPHRGSCSRRISEWDPSGDYNNNSCDHLEPLKPQSVALNALAYRRQQQQQQQQVAAKEQQRNGATRASGTKLRDLRDSLLDISDSSAASEVTLPVEPATGSVVGADVGGEKVNELIKLISQEKVNSSSAANKSLNSLVSCKVAPAEANKSTKTSDTFNGQNPAQDSTEKSRKFKDSDPNPDPKPNLNPKEQQPQDKSTSAAASSQQPGDLSGDWQPLDWNVIADRYGKMSRKESKAASGSGVRHSCCGQMLVSIIYSVFPFFGSFKGYTFPRDLMSDMFAGFTVAVLHIPQGMAYGMLAGVEPIYGLYTSLVPVLVMALMSRSRHVSYGTFAIVSMLLANACQAFRSTVDSQRQAYAKDEKNAIRSPMAEAQALVITNNHQPVDQQQQQAKFQLKNLFGGDDHESLSSTTSSITIAPPVAANGWPLGSGSDTLDSIDSLPSPSNIEILTCICLLVGIFQILMSLMRLGVLSLMFSDQLVSSFTTASAIHVVTSQFGALFDISMPSLPEQMFQLIHIWRHLALRLMQGFNQYTALLSLFSIIFLLVIKDLIEPRLRRRFESLTSLPSELLLIIVLIFSSWYWQFNSVYNIRIVGHVPTGLPELQVPQTSIMQFVWQDSLTIALVSFAINLSMAQVYAKRYRYKLEPNQELFALGSANFVGSFFSCFPCASSLSRSAVQSSLRPKSQMCSLVSCAIVVSIICFFAPILHDLPRSTLSCIIVVALKGILMQVKDLYENWRLSKLDALVWLATFVSVLAFGVTYGLLLGIAASLFMVFFRLLTPNHSILGQLPGTEIYVDKSTFMDCVEIEQVKIFRFNSALCYLNRTMFKESVEKSLPTIYKPRGFERLSSWHSSLAGHRTDEVKFLVIDCSALAYCDYSGAATLVEIVEELEELQVVAYLAACPMKLIEMLERMHKIEVLKKNVYPSISEALSQAKHLKRLKPGIT